MKTQTCQLAADQQIILNISQNELECALVSRSRKQQLMQYNGPLTVCWLALTKHPLRITDNKCYNHNG